MRVRLQLLLPLVLATGVAAALAIAGLGVAAAVRSAGPEPETALAAALRALLLWGAAAVLAAAALGAVLARVLAAPLARIREAAQRLVQAEPGVDAGTRIAEMQDLARGIARAADELRRRHDRALRERSELAALVDAASEGILQLDAGGRIVRVNAAARAQLALPADALGRSVGALIRSAELRRLLERGAGGSASETAEVTVDERRIRVSVAPLGDGGAVATSVDLTDLRRLEEVRRDFVANASHELKTPLTSIRGYSETLLDAEVPAAERREFLGIIARNAERLQRIVDDLLDLSRLESGRWEPELGSVDVAALAAGSWHGFSGRAAARGVELSVDADPSATRVSADRAALEHVFANLYDNALRHTTGRTPVTVRVRREAGERARRGQGRSTTAPPLGEWIVVDVADAGAGIPRDALPRIFERFYRVDPARSRAEGGTGLGLAIVRHLIETMGGGVTAVSELGRGTTIRFWLPPAG